MYYTIVAATLPEVMPFVEELRRYGQPMSDTNFVYAAHQFQICITGVGIAHTALALGMYPPDTKPAHVFINAGIAGSLDHSVPLGTVFEVVSDAFADLGAEDRDGSFMHAWAMGLANKSLPGGRDIYDEAGVLHIGQPMFGQELRAVHGITVNKVHGSEASIRQVQDSFPAATTESMEGAAFMMACLHRGWRCTQVRAISNWVEPRNRASWQIGSAIECLNDFLVQTLLR